MSFENHNCFPIQMEEEQLLDINTSLTKDCCCRGSMHTFKPQVISSRTSELLKQLDVNIDLSMVERKKVYKVTDEFSDVFVLTPAELGQTELVRHTINTGDHPLIKQLPHWTPFAWRRQIEQIIKMLEQEVVKLSSTPWASLVVLLPKKGGSTRFCMTISF